MKNLRKWLAALLCVMILPTFLIGCARDKPDALDALNSMTEPEEPEPEEEEDFQIQNTVWQGENWLVFLADDTLLVFDETGEMVLQDTYEWYGITGRTNLLIETPYLEIEDGRLVAFGGEDGSEHYYEQTDRIPGTDPADGYILENSTWHCDTNDKYTFYEDGYVMLHNWYLGYTYEGTYEWDVHEKTGSIDMGDYTTDLVLNDEGYLCLTDVEGCEQWAGRGLFEQVTDFFALRGQEEEIKGTWYAAAENTYLTFDGTGGAVYTDSDGTEYPLTEFTHGYFFDGTKLTLITGVIVRTGQPELEFGSLESDGSLHVSGAVYERVEE